MPPIPTEVLNEDVKELKGDLRSVRSDLDVVRADVHRIDVGLGELRAEFRFAKWLVGALLALTFSGLGSGIWWASGLTMKVGAMESRFNEKFQEVGTRIDKLETNLDARFDRIDARFDKIDARFDKLESAIARLIEQGRPVQPRPGP